MVPFGVLIDFGLFVRWFSVRSSDPAMGIEGRLVGILEPPMADAIFQMGSQRDESDGDTNVQHLDDRGGL